MLYESRVYTAVPGKLPALNDWYSNRAIGILNQHDIGIMGFWTDEIGASNQLTYILTFNNMADREKKWSAFAADETRLQAFAEAEVDGPLVAKVNTSFMHATPYSPEPQLSSNVQEMRVYDAMPGMLPALHNRFSNHTMRLFERHGIENIAYWTEVVGRTHNRLVYMLGYPSLGDREKGWAAFQADPDWVSARTESEKDGPLVRVSRHSIMRLTPYSPR